MLYTYIKNEKYNKDAKINKNTKIQVFTKKELDKQYPNAEILGETKQHNKKHRIAKIAFADNKVYKVSKFRSHSRILYSANNYVQVGENQFVALVQLRLAFIILLSTLVTAVLTAGVIAIMTFAAADDDITLIPDDNAEYVGEIGYSLGGYIVDENDEAVIGANVKLMMGAEELASMTSNGTGSFMYRNVPSGYYMVVVEVDGKTITKLAYIDAADETLKIQINRKSGSSEVDVTIKDNKDYAVGDVDKEAEETEKDIKITLSEKANLTNAAEAAMPNAFKDADVSLKVYEATATVDGQITNKTEKVLKIAVPFVTSNLAKFEVFRYNGEGKVFTKLDAEPTNPEDGTYYINGNYVVLYLNQFGEIAFVTGEDNGIIETETTVGFEKFVYVDIASGTADFYFYHYGKDASAVLDLIAYDTNGNEVVLMTTGNIGNGYKLETAAIDTSKLVAGNYSGLLRARYVNNNGSVMDTNIDMPVTIIVK